VRRPGSTWRGANSNVTPAASRSVGNWLAGKTYGSSVGCVEACNHRAQPLDMGQRVAAR
jgi:hypothetical protein